mgnify:CR=1 FL=1
MKQKLPVEFIFLLLVGAFFLGVFVNQKFAAKSQVIPKEENKTANNLEILQEKVLPKNGYRFKINWGILGKKMIDDGVIDKVKLAKALTGKEILGANFDKYLKKVEELGEKFKKQFSAQTVAQNILDLYNQFVEKNN